MRYRFGYLITATVLFSIAFTLQLKDSLLEVRGAMAQTPQGLQAASSVFSSDLNSNASYLNRLMALNIKFKGADHILTKVNNLTQELLWS